jgi:hypothetical protein
MAEGQAAAGVSRGVFTHILLHTNASRRRRPGVRLIFNATLRTAAGWLFFRVDRSTRMTRIWALYRHPARTALKNSQLTCGDIAIICETGCR